MLGFGIELLTEARLQADDVGVVGSHATGVALRSGATFVATDLVVADTRTDGTDHYGIGLEVFDESHAELDRAAILRSVDVGVGVLRRGSSLRAADLLVREVLPWPEGGIGFGIETADGATIELVRTRVERARVVGVLAATDGTIVAEDLVVTGTLEGECTDSCAVPGGNGIDSLDRGVVDVTRFELTDNALCGVQILGGGVMDLHDGLVAGNRVGANVQQADFDVLRLQDGVLYRDNERTLDPAALPAPSGVEVGGR
jgi:alanine dehydrogenase